MSDNKALKWDLTHPPKNSKTLSDEPQLEEWRRLMREAVTAIEELEAQIADLRSKLDKYGLRELARAGQDCEAGWQPIETALDLPGIASGELVIHVWWPHKLQKRAAFDSCMRKAQWDPELKEWQIEAVSGAIAPTPTHWRPLPEPPKEQADE